MRKVLIILVFISSIVFGKDLVCNNEEGMVLKMSADKWDETTVSGRVEVSFTYKGKLMSKDENAGFSDSPYIIGGKIKLPDNDKDVTLFIQLKEDFKKASAFLFIEEETLPYGVYDCK